MLIANFANADELTRWLDRADASLANTTPLYRTLANIGVADSQEAFAEQSWHGDPWPALSPVTVLSRSVNQKRGFKRRQKSWGIQSSYRIRGSGNILHPTGQHILNTIGVIEVRDDYARYGTPTPWAHVHNAGATIHTAFGTITLPKRQFIGLDEPVVEKMLKGVGHWLEEDVLRA